MKYPVLESDCNIVSFYKSALRDKSMLELGIGTMHKMKSFFQDIFLPVWSCKAYTVGEKINIWNSKFSFLPKTNLLNELLSTDFTIKIQKPDLPVYLMKNNERRHTSAYTSNIFSFNSVSIKKDILIFLGLALVLVPVVFVSGFFLSIMIWGNSNVPTDMMFGPIEKSWVYILLIAFPITIAFGELATYFVHVMQKLKKQLKVKWLAVLLPIVFLSIQHCTLPFIIPDLNFIMYHALVFLPFLLFLLLHFP